METVKAMQFNWKTLDWEPVEVHRKFLEAVRHTSDTGNSRIRQLVSLAEYEFLRKTENHFKLAADPALVGLMDWLPGKLNMPEPSGETQH